MSVDEKKDQKFKSTSNIHKVSKSVVFWNQRQGSFVVSLVLSSVNKIRQKLTLYECKAKQSRINSTMTRWFKRFHCRRQSS